MFKKKPKKISLKEAKRLVRRIVNEHGYEYQYIHEQYQNEYGVSQEVEYCLYTTADGKPSCIIGHLLRRVAPGALKQLHTTEWGDYGTIGPESLTVLELDGYRKGVPDLTKLFEEDALPFLWSVQMEQDSGASWGKSLEESLARY